MVMRTVRVTRTWDVEVEAEYGDDRDALMAKVDDKALSKATPGESRVILEEHESEYAKWWDHPDADPAMVELYHEAKKVRTGWLAGVQEWWKAVRAAEEAKAEAEALAEMQGPVVLSGMPEKKGEG